MLTLYKRRLPVAKVFQPKFVTKVPETQLTLSESV